MPRPKPEPGTEGKRINIYLDAKSLKMWRQIDNASNFVQQCLEDPVGIMAWAIMKKQKQFADVDKNQPKLEEILPVYNKEFPLDKLTAKRLGKPWRDSSPKRPDPLL